MRDIKFRIWDTENNEMLKVQELDFEPTFYGGRIAIRPDQYNNYFDTEDMILMQYTGLKDKNGKEIYEGDIVAIQGDLKSFKTQVEWHKDIAAFILKDLQILDVDIANFTTVIGNIYDNPELL